jgi:NAD+ kinase
MTWGLISKQCKKSFQVGKKVYHYLLHKKEEVLVEQRLADHLSISGHTIKSLGKKIDKAITIGGDGTILMALEHITQPIFSINTGVVGFLTEVEEKDALSGLQSVLDNNYFLEERLKLKTLLNKKRLPDGANEVTIQTPLIGKILEFKLYVGGKLVEQLEGDGIIIATPTGSTSYALSVGGPVVDPVIEALVVAPIAPFRHYASPLVIPAHKELQIVLFGKRDAKAAIDGHHTYSLKLQDTLTVTKSENKACFIRLQDTFYQRVYEKLCQRR